MNPISRPLDFSGANWPNPTQLLLLQACLSSGAEAVSAWRAWQSKIALDDIDYGSLRLIPLLYHNLRQLDVVDDDLGRYQGIHRKYWYENQLRFRQAADVIKLCQNAGIPTLALKGVPLAHLYYPETSLRPMSDFDVLVPYDQPHHAMATLQAAGWVLVSRLTSVRGTNAWTFAHPKGGNTDLHWRILMTRLGPDSDILLWQSAEKFSFSNTHTLTLNPTDHLFHTCVHGMPANEVASLRWIVDAMMILRKSTIDWERLLIQSQDHSVVRMIHHAFSYLHTFLNAHVPESILERMAAAPFESWEKAELKNLGSHSYIAFSQRVLWLEFQRYRRNMQEMPPLSILSSYSRYLEIRLGLDHISQLPWYALKKTGRLSMTKFRKTLCPPQRAGHAIPKPSSRT